MKKTVAILACIMHHIGAFATENQKTISSKINHVTVFMQGAQIDRSGYTTLPKGNSIVVFDGVSQFINRTSIKASGKGDFSILDVQYNYVYPKPGEIDSQAYNKLDGKIEKLQDSINSHNLEMANIRAKKKAIETEKGVILKHPLLNGQGKRDSLDLLKTTIKYLEDQLANIADRYLTLQKRELVMTKIQTRMNKRMQELKNYKANFPRPAASQPKHQVHVSVYAEKATKAKISVTYKVNNAGWSPWYDITAKDAGDDVSLVYKAAVWQNTGIDWKNAKLRISNANPNQNNTKPVLPRWYIDYYRNMQVRQTRQPRYFKSQAEKAIATTDADEVESVNDDVLTKDAGMAYDYSQKIQNFSSVEFDIDLPYSIKSTGKAHFVTVHKHNLNASFKHYLVPKLDKDAFVVARILDWENLDLLVGNANIYFGNTFIGRTVLDPTIVTDTLEVSMGRYRSMAIKRTKLKEKTKNKVVGPKKVYTATYQIELRNNSANPINLALEDQIPVTNNQNIEIELTKPDGGTLNEYMGLITWDFKLKPYEKKTVTYTYTITYPKEEEIRGI